MRTSRTFRRLATAAATITVAGVVVPVALASSASAAEATGITATPPSQTVSAGTSAPYQATLTPAGSTSAHGVDYAITAGPSHVALSGTTCTDGSSTGSGPFTCDVSTTGFTPGTYTVTIFDDSANTGTFQNSDPNTTVSLTVAGTESAYTVTPSSQAAAQNICAAYSGTAKDANGTPAVGQTVTLAASQTSTTTGTNGPSFCTPGTTFANSTSTAPTGSGPYNYTATSSAVADSNGQFTFGVESGLTGAVNITVGGTASGSNNPATATLTVDPGTSTANSQTQNNDVAKAITVSPTSQNAFTTKPTTYTATVKNANGDVLGGVQPSYVVTSGPDATSTPVTCTVSNGKGMSTCSITPSAAGTDNLTTYVEQDTNAPNNATGPNAGEPQTTSTITVTTEPRFNNPPTATCAGTTSTSGTCKVPASQATEAVTFTFTQDNTAAGGSATAPSQGQTVNFSTTSTDAGVSISPASATTDANGQVTVTVTHNAGTNNSVPVKATLASDSAITGTETVVFQKAAASAGTFTLTPQNQTKAVGSQVTVTATAKDQFGAAVSGDVINFMVQGPRNTTTNNSGATGTCTTGSTGTCTFTYTDKGPALTGTTEQTDTVQATDTTSGKMDSATVTFVAGTATASTVTLTVNGNTSANATTTTDPTGTASAPVQTIVATVQDANTNNLVNDSVTFTSSGVGTFADATGHPVSGSTETVATDSNGQATVYVRSTTAGTQTVTASADGVTSNPVTVNYTNSQFTSVTPERILDSRSGQGSVSTNNGGEHTGALAPNTLYYFDLNSTDVPQDQAAYVFNVTAVQPSGAGNLRIAPGCAANGTRNTQVPATSLVNYQSGQDVANDVVLPNVRNCNYFVLYSAGSSANVVIDFQGYYASTAAFTGSNPPARVVDTRTGQGGHTGVVAANTSASFTIAGQGGVPATTSTTPARAVAINVTAIGPGGVGNLRVYPDGASVPTTSNINYVPGVDKAAFVVVQLPADGKIDVYSAGSSANVAIDVFGYYPSTSTVVTQTPVRVYDSRSAGVELRAGNPTSIVVAGPGATAGGVPANAQAVLISLTAVHAADSTGVGNLRVYPGGEATPTVSNVNYIGKTADVANFAIVPVGTNGQITLYSAGSNINATVDILGYVPVGS